jgi:hypothetical protein
MQVTLNLAVLWLEFFDRLSKISRNPFFELESHEKDVDDGKLASNVMLTEVWSALVFIFVILP